MLRILVVDDHPTVINGTIPVLQQHFPEAKIDKAEDAQTAENQVETFQPNVVVMDLCIPQTTGVDAKIDTGLQLLRNLMQKYLTLNLVVQSAHIKALLRIKPSIDAHTGGFTVADKSLSSPKMLKRVEWALQGLAHTRDMNPNQTGVELKPEWLRVLDLAFNEGLQDKAIAKRMHISERMVRHYWSRIQDALNVYPEDGTNIRIRTQMRARDIGLID